MEFTEFVKSLARGVPPAVVLAGPEGYLVRRGVQRIRQALPASSVLRFDGDEAPWERIALELGSPMLDSSDRLILVAYGPGRGLHAAERAGIGAFARAPAPGTHLAVELPGEKPPEGPDLAGVTVVPCVRPNAEVLDRWLRSEARELGRDLDARAVRVLLERGRGLSMSELALRLETMCLFAGPQVSVKAVEEFLPPDLEADTFRLADALTDGRLGDALALLRRLLERDTSPQMILGGLAWAARRYAEAARLAAEGVNRVEITRRLRVQWAQDRFLDTARKIGPAAWAARHRRILEADRSMKTGTPPESALEALVLDWGSNRG